MTVEAIRSPQDRKDSAAAGPAPRVISAAASILILVVAAWHMLTAGTHADVSWLLAVGDKMLAGERLYVDIWENNPPLPAILYLPMAWLGAVTPLAAETWTVLVTGLWVTGFGAFALYMSTRLGLTSPRERLILVPAGLYVLLLIMPETFSQREHFALASALPMLVLNRPAHGGE